MKATYEDGTVRVERDARQQLYDASGFGTPLDGDAVALTPVEAAYLLAQGKLEDIDGDGYAAFARRALDDTATLRVYSDLRDRGYYLSHDDALCLYERGDHPANSTPETRVEAVSEDAVVEPARLPSLLAVADDDGDVTYFAVERTEPEGDFADVTQKNVEAAPTTGSGVAVGSDGTLAEARYGSERPDDALVLSSVEAAYLARRGVLDADTEADDHRLAVYADLRDRGTCPRTGFKFGADFRLYETTDDDHAALLVSALDSDARVPVVEVSRAVRLAHGVKKKMSFALVGDGVEYVVVERERP